MGIVARWAPQVESRCEMNPSTHSYEESECVIGLERRRKQATRRHNHHRSVRVARASARTYGDETQPTRLRRSLLPSRSRQLSSHRPRRAAWGEPDTCRAAQFVQDQRDAAALVASQDGRFHGIRLVAAARHGPSPPGRGLLAVSPVNAAVRDFDVASGLCRAQGVCSEARSHRPRRHRVEKTLWVNG